MWARFVNSLTALTRNPITLKINAASSSQVCVLAGPLNTANPPATESTKKVVVINSTSVSKRPEAGPTSLNADRSPKKSTRPSP